MRRKANTIVFLVGLGAPAAIYIDLIKKIREQIPHETFHVLEWWNQDDFGKSELNRYLQDQSTILIGHSAGGSMAIHALADSPDKISRVVMLDSHTLTALKPLPPIGKFLDVLLSGDGAEVIDKVRHAYVSVVKDSTSFDRALDFLSKWVKNDLPRVGVTIKAMQSHTVLHMGFTDSQYQVLNAENQNELKNLWGQYNFDTQFLPMTHFELIMPSRAKMVAQAISDWLGKQA